MQKKLYDRYSARFYALCKRYSVDDDEAQDMLVEGFVYVFSSITDYRGEGSFEGWMHSIFLRTAIKFVRSNTRRKRIIEPLDDRDFNSESPDLSTQIDIKDALVEALRSMEEEERLMFNLITVEGYTLADVAEEIGIPVSTLKSRYYKVLKALRITLTNRLGNKFLEKYK